MRKRNSVEEITLSACLYDKGKNSYFVLSPFYCTYNML